MTTHQEMTALFGPLNLTTVPPHNIERFSLRPQDAKALAELGLPRLMPPFFTTEVEGGPELLTVIDVTTRDGKDHREVIIGGPPGDSGMRFSVDAYEGFITLAQLDGAQPRGEVVNNNLTDFIEFLYRIESYRTRTDIDPSTQEADFQELKSTLLAIDPFSFELAEDWWSIALRQLRGGGIGL